MSVRKNERSEGTLQVLNLCAKLTEYTIGRCASEKVFPKKTRWIMSNKVVNECIDAYTCIKRANSVYVKTDSDAEYRRSQQIQAHSHIGALIGLIDIAFRSFDIDVKTIEYWSSLAVDTDTKLLAWMKSDKNKK